MNRLEPITRRWRGSLLQQGWRLWLTELRACVPAWLMPPAPPEQVYHWPLTGFILWQNCVYQAHSGYASTIHLIIFFFLLFFFIRVEEEIGRAHV